LTAAVSLLSSFLNRWAWTARVAAGGIAALMLNNKRVFEEK
jgi:hypothetical protein